MRSRAAAWLAGLALLASLQGCASALNAATYRRYYAAATESEQAGDLQQAKIFWSRALINAQLGDLGPDAESAALYNYARVVGQLCEPDLARTSFRRALELTEQQHGPGGQYASLRLFELARLECDQGNPRECAAWYDRAVPLVRAHEAQGDPIAFANELDRYAGALEQVGAGERAAALRAESAALRAANPTATARFVPARYPAPCPPAAAPAPAS
jgi:tetratricopeptide (TPR) repeat protein